MSEERQSTYRVILNVDADGGMWITLDYAGEMTHDFHLSPGTIEQLEDDLAHLHGKHANALNNENLYGAINILHGIFWKAKDRWYKEKQGDGEDTNPANDG